MVFKEGAIGQVDFEQRLGNVTRQHPHSPKNGGFAHYLEATELFGDFVAGCPLFYLSNNAPNMRAGLGRGTHPEIRPGLSYQLKGMGDCSSVKRIYMPSQRVTKSGVVTVRKLHTPIPMEVHARISKEWRKRMLFMFFMIFGIAAWFLGDGYYFWPNEAGRHAEYTGILDELIEAGKAENAESSSVQIAWQRHARERGYKSKVPKERAESAIREQRVIGWVIMAGSLGFLAWIGWNHTRSVRAEGETVIGASGERVEFDSIVATDRRKWKNKGIAYALYEANGKTKRLCLDDHKFAGCEAILLEAERRIKAREEA